MPIKPKNKKLYPPKKKWNAIRADILTRAGNCCEMCGVRNGTYIYRNETDKSIYIIYNPMNDGFYRPDKTPIRQSEIPHDFDVSKQPTRVVLTIAHLDHNPTNNAPDNLKAMCQYDHLRFDAQYHAQNAAKTRAAKKHKTQQSDGQLSLFSEE